MGFPAHELIVAGKVCSNVVTTKGTIILKDIRVAALLYVNDGVTILEIFLQIWEKGR